MKLSKFMPLVVGMLLATSSAMSAETAGFVERIKGKATATSVDGVTELKQGSTIYEDDSLKTTTGSRLVIKFNDGSKLTMGEEALIIVDDLVYESAAPEQSTKKQTLDIVRGVFSFVSGAIAKANYENVVMRTPVATIGIRGTEFLGGELTVGMTPGRPHYGFQISEGAIEVMTPAGSVTLDEPGEGTFLPLTRIAAPTPVRQWTPEEAQEALDALAF